MSLDARPTVAEPDDDPYLWLEDIEGERALAWVAAENDRTLKTFGGAEFAADRDTLAAILDRPDKLPLVVRRGPWLYNFWLDAKNPRGLWRRTTLESFRLDQPAWEILLDVDALAAAEGEDWIWGGAATRPGTHDRAILRLSRGGSDAVVLREFDLASRTFVKDGFVLPEAKGWVSWLDPDTLLLSSAWGGDVTTSGYARTVRLWRRGSDAAQAPVLFEVPRESMTAGGERRPRSHLEARLVRRACRLLRRQFLAGGRRGRQPRQARPADRRRDADAPRIGWRSSRARPGRSAARPGPPTACSASGSTRSWPAAAISPCSSSRLGGGCCRASSGAPVGWCCRSSTTCSRCSRSSRRPTTAGRGKA